MFGPSAPVNVSRTSVVAGVERDLLGGDLPGRPGAGGIEGERRLIDGGVDAQFQRPIAGRAVGVAEIERVQAGLRDVDVPLDVLAGRRAEIGVAGAGEAGVDVSTVGPESVASLGFEHAHVSDLSMMLQDDLVGVLR